MFHEEMLIRAHIVDAEAKLSEQETVRLNMLHTSVLWLAQFFYYV
jgi:hypothetical protein